MPTAPSRNDSAGADRLERWRRRGSTLEVEGRRVFFVDEGDRSHPVVAIFHGFPSCSFDFWRVLPLLTGRFRVIVHDHPGFGFSDKTPTASYSLLDQATVAAGLWRRLDVERCHLIAHDYGTSVATELLARRAEGRVGVELESITLSNGSIYLEMARLFVTQRLLRHPWTGPLIARLTPRAFFLARMRSLWGEPRQVDEVDLDALWLAAAHDGGRALLHRLSGYLDERERHRARWTAPLEQLDRPTLVLWGRADPIAVPAIAERLARTIPGSRLRWLDRAGHYPMLEDPRGWSQAVMDFLAQH